MKLMISLGTVVCACFALLCLLTATQEIPRVEPPVDSAAVVVQTTEPPAYHMRIYQDGLALFRGDAKEPYQRLEVELSLLSDYDRAALETGITVRTEAELRALVEDFTS